MKLAALTFITGLILAMSEGPWFPWPNLAGVAIFSLSPVLAWRADRRARADRMSRTIKDARDYRR